MPPFDPSDITSHEQGISQTYRNICGYKDEPGLSRRRELAAEAEEFKKLGLGTVDFFANLRREEQFRQNFWELRLGILLARAGMNPKRRTPRPDFVISQGESEVWIEATAASRGAGMRGLGPVPEAISFEQMQQGAEIPTYCPDFEGSAIRIECRMSEKISHIRKDSDLIRSESIPVIVALDITDIDDQFHRGHIGPVFYGLSDSTSKIVNGRHVASVTAVESVSKPGTLEKDVGFFRRESLLGGVLLARGGLLDSIDELNRKLLLLINPQADFPVPGWVLPQVQRLNQLEEWRMEGAEFRQRGVIGNA